MAGFLSARLAAVLSAVGEFAGASGGKRLLADIGTDHAYLPIEAVRAGLCERAVACDVSEGPLKIAKKNIKAAGLCEKIETRLGDGLLPLIPLTESGGADCIVIAGMGGMNICEILAAAPAIAKNAEKTPRLILQPQHDLEELRRFLHANLYNILEEKLARERGRFYVILAAQAACEIQPYTDAEYFLGRFAPGKTPELLSYLHDKHEKISRYAHAITDDTGRELAEKRLAWIKEKIAMQFGSA